ncbi:PQQ-dependent sugar dehydrogenase [Caldovatus aquaticus]|uniref:PQQ-dependent sugar dehydrogenase n=1 Tax=Caldovatus aquaticus TaxID=2865671 RepID=A0ABS7EXE3_9PROT|nr:PQQ-dependent sugar dehydrogenase [Caldovatus aquaticus]MBW8268029.1 PQQ-dependent sugar dehydrogenase [Caldovatus aquaticus]
MIRRSLAFGLAVALAASGVAWAQQQQQQPPPAWAQGRPPEMANSRLAPHPPRLTVTPPEQVPVAALRVPAGFRVELWAHGIPGARMMTLGQNGTVFVGTRVIGRVYAVTDEGGQRRVRTIAERLNQPNGVAFRDGSLYVIAINRVLRYDGIEGRLDDPGTPVELTAAFNLPPDEHHGWKFAAFSPDGRLTMNIGVPCNICEFDRDRYGLIVSFRPDGSDRRIEAKGIRNSVGFDWHPVTRELWATNNGRDWAGNDVPPDTLHRIRRPGEDHGFPFCVGDWNDPAVPRRNCSEFVQPAASLGPHVAALGMRFYTGAMFPEQYRNQIFIARRGSWNREQLIGYDVVVARLDAQGNVTGIEPFLTGLLDQANDRFLGRPVDVLQLRDGSLLVSDEQNGAIYRISRAQ